MSVEDAFATLLGRQVSSEERERLYRIREVLRLDDNDAVWLIVLALEHYDATFRKYPAELGEVTRATLESVRGAYAAAAAQEAARAQRLLTERVAQASRQVASQRAELSFSWTAASLGMAAIVAFGALCVTAGYELSLPTRPYWASPQAPSGFGGAAAIVLGVPAGWMIFALVLPAAAYVGRAGWQTAREPDARPAQKAAGWALVALATLASVACAAALGRRL